jgi:predicted transcriptional regulator
MTPPVNSTRKNTLRSVSKSPKNKTRKNVKFRSPVNLEEVRRISPESTEDKLKKSYKKRDRLLAISSISRDEEYKQYLESLKNLSYRHSNPKKYRQDVIRLQKARSLVLDDIRKHHTPSSIRSQKKTGKSPQDSKTLEPTIYVPRQYRKTPAVPVVAPVPPMQNTPHVPRQYRKTPAAPVVQKSSSESTMNTSEKKVVPLRDMITRVRDSLFGR